MFKIYYTSKISKIYSLAFIIGKAGKICFKQRRETFRRSKALDSPVFQKNPFVSIPSNDSLDEVFEENNNNRKESLISFETTKGKLII
jgi:hypothetical protein